MSTTTAPPRRKDLLDIESLSREEIVFLLETARPFKDLFTRSVKKVPALRGKTVLNLFFESSTRTRASFEIAAKRLSADVTNLAITQSSVTKGESILDTVETMQSMKVDYMVVRHAGAGVPAFIAKHTPAAVINAGDGNHAHPTQALLDAFTMREAVGELAGRKILLVGDLLHSRVSRSVSTIARKLGMDVGIFAPGTLVPRSGSTGPRPPPWQQRCGKKRPAPTSRRRAGLSRRCRSRRRRRRRQRRRLLQGSAPRPLRCWRRWRQRRW